MAKLVFITGASSGIGQALALAYYEAGFNLALIARRTEEIKSWSNQHDIRPERYKIYSSNVSDIDDIVATGKVCIATQGLPDVVIANAGISVGVDSAIREDLDQLALTFATNNIGLAATFHPFIDGMRQRKSGKLVGIASVAGKTLAELGLNWNHAACMGDDWPDLPVLQASAFACAPSHAHFDVKAIADYITEAPAGSGAVRELCDLLLTAAGKYAQFLAEFQPQQAQPHTSKVNVA